MTKIVIEKITCDKCGKDVTQDNYRTESANGRLYDYCIPCLYEHGHQCDICLDTFIHLGAHKRGE
jgi:hypothetical protein